VVVVAMVVPALDLEVTQKVLHGRSLGLEGHRCGAGCAMP
jgi:hypothetical protein